MQSRLLHRSWMVVVLTLALASVHQVAGQYGPPMNPPGQPPARPAPPPPQPPPPAAPPATTEPAAPKPELPPVDPKWLERMPKEDRAALDETLGYAPPPFSENLKWFQTEPTDWAKLRGKVIVLQSFTTGTSARSWPARVAKLLDDVSAADLQIIALHTPDKADTAEDFLAKQKPPANVLVAIDSVGDFCDSLGIYKHPVNLIVDRNGMVRYAGLNPNGLKQAVADLVKEPVDVKKVPPPRPIEKPAEEGAATAYPVIKGKVYGAADLRGKRAPEFVSEQWYTNQPNPAGKVVVVTFWSIDNSTCIASHPALNDLAAQFENVCFVALSEDSRSNFEEGMARRRIDKSDLKYVVALDRSRKMAEAMSVTAIPHTIVMSKDWIVRWQGRPGELTSTMLQQVIDADAASPPADKPGAAGKKRGWVQ